MSDKLFRVDASTSVMVYAEDAKEAVLLAKGAAAHEFMAAEFDPVHVKYADEVPTNWLKYVPYWPTRIKQIGDTCNDLITIRPANQSVSQEEPVAEVVKPEPIAEVVKPIAESNKPMPPLKFNIPVPGRQ